MRSNPTVNDSIVAAEWVLPIAGAAIHHGAVAVREGRIAWVGSLESLPSEFAGWPVALHAGVLTPGLVNGHTHLQYTGFADLGRGSYTSFEHWSEEFEVFYDAVQDPAEWGRAARDGAALALASGTTAFAEIVTDEPARGVLAEFGLQGIEYLEAIGETETRWNAGGREAFTAWLDQPTAGVVGVSPHAPYSLDGEVIRELTALARSRGMRIHSHVGESEVEASLYDFGNRDVLEIYGDMRDEFALIRNGGTGLSTARYAASIDLLGADSHLAHGIYLDRADRDLLRDSGTRVALCPRSNRVIGLAAAPVADYLREGHEIAVGTDSLSSSPSLDLLADVAALAELATSQGYADADLHERVLYAATVGGAAVLDRTDIGALREGMRADLAVFDVKVAEGEDPRTALVTRGEGSCTLTVIGGDVRHARGA
ncbi:amidohydrolase family protein [Leucobacter aridicollis]|uniref:Cytosine/adenosine deaminase-related metal-dependent hydrolase n=1 Tax=Leucobacter aridicollis TaxID=283878 RepID=A0A852QXQ3_9MICO|nr:amidohydrolase family protein [Leucobacter aridicollis]NYD27163.1 cytosine/adenosine deaminase-related metal-dependent hydrolase [Leucobacter aridicollis]